MCFVDNLFFYLDLKKYLILKFLDVAIGWYAVIIIIFLVCCYYYCDQNNFKTLSLFQFRTFLQLYVWLLLSVLFLFFLTLNMFILNYISSPYVFLSFICSYYFHVIYTLWLEYFCLFQNSCWNLIPNRTVLGGVAIRRWLSFSWLGSGVLKIGYDGGSSFIFALLSHLPHEETAFLPSGDAATRPH